MRGFALETCATTERVCSARPRPAPDLGLAGGVAALAAALPLAWLIGRVHAAFPQQPERTVSWLAVGFAVRLALSAAGGWLVTRPGLPTVCFRQSCIYGPGQFGAEDQGWVAWFAIRALQNLPVTIYGDGRQVRDVLFIEDLLEAYDDAVENIDNTRGQAEGHRRVRQSVSSNP